MNWIHHLERGSGDLTLLLLHGTGGDEHQLMQLGRQVSPSANLLGVQGRSLEEGSPRFFRRFSATKYDQEHLKAEADALAQFVPEAAQEYGLDASKVVALGYSNGANIALATLARHPQAFAGAALLRPVMALEEPPLAELNGLPVLVLNGKRDPYAPFGTAVTPYLSERVAQVTDHQLNAGHELTMQDVQLVQQWLGALNGAG